MSRIIAVFAEPPLPGQCAKPLLPYNDPEWVARLYAAMLRDTLDGLESLMADHYLVFTDADDEGRRALERHLPVPWTLSAPRDVSDQDYVIVATADAPAAEITPLASALEQRVPVVANEGWLAGGPALALAAPTIDLVTKLRAECTNLVTLPPATIVDGPSALETLLEELRRHHARAPRTAVVAMTS